MNKENATATDSEKPTKKKKLLLTLKRPPRFGESVSENLTELSKPILPHNTVKKYCLGCEEIQGVEKQESSALLEEVCPEDLHDHSPFDIVRLNRWLSLFIYKMRRSDGKQHPFTAKPLHN